MNCKLDDIAYNKIDKQAIIIININDCAPRICGGENLWRDRHYFINGGEF